MIAAVIICVLGLPHLVCAQTAPTTEEAPTAEYKYSKGTVITIHSDISDVTTASLRRRIELARRDKSEIIIFDIDTPGGMVSSALDICQIIKKDLADIKTVAWVNSDAYSAGSMISVACDEIVMSRSSTIGDCGVILGGPMGPQEVPEELRAKAESPVLEQFRDSAAFNHYDPLLCESLVIKELEVFWLENLQTGEKRFALEVEKNRLLRETIADDNSNSSRLPDDEEIVDESPIKTWQLVESYIDPITGRSIKVSQPVVPSTELLTMSQSRATALGFCKAILSNLNEVQEHYSIAGQISRYDTNWSEDFTAWLTSMPVRIFLLLILMLGVYVEFNTPGVGVPGTVALICLAIFVGAPYLTGLANVWELVVVLIGFALLAVEVFVIPGFGIAGISGVLCIIIGLLATFIPDEPGRSFPIYWPEMEDGLEGLKIGIVTMASAGTAAVVAMIIISRMLPKITWLHGAIPPNPTREDVQPIVDYHQGYAKVGDIGIVESPLRPAGKVRFGPALVDVVTEGDFVDPKTEVQVIECQGNRVVVRRLT